MSYEHLQLLTELREGWDQSLFGRVLIWILAVYGLITLMIVVVEIGRELFKFHLDKQEANALLVLWATALTLIGITLGLSRILTVIPDPDDQEVQSRSRVRRPLASLKCPQISRVGDTSPATAKLDS